MYNLSEPAVGISMGEKEDLELAACIYFINRYNQEHNTNLELVKHTDKPDFILSDAVTGERVGVEVTHLYYDENEAKMILGRMTNKTYG